MSLSGKHAVVTGGGTGIGLAISNSLINAGAMVTIMGRNEARLEKVVKNNRFMAAVRADITDEESVKQAVQKALSYAPIDILVNNAGNAESKPFHQTDYENWKHMIDINLNGTFLMTRAVIESMIERNSGNIINVASTAGLKGYAFMAGYSAAKHGIVGMTRSIAAELSNSNIRANALCPGFVNTNLVRNGIKSIITKHGCSEEEALERMLGQDNQPRLIEPEEVGEQAVWLCNNDVNGQAILMDGSER